MKLNIVRRAEDIVKNTNHGFYICMEGYLRKIGPTIYLGKYRLSARGIDL